MTDETRRLLDKLDRNLNDILFDLVEENETLEGQVDELREQVARLAGRGSSKGDLISRQAVIDAIQKLNIPEDMCVFEIISHIEVAIATMPSVEKNESSEEWYKLFCEKWDEGEWVFNFPEGMKNGEVMNLVLRKIFPRTIFIRGNDPCHKIKSINYSEEWENAPYKTEKGGE